jgi:hypothetical protein
LAAIKSLQKSFIFFRFDSSQNGDVASSGSGLAFEIQYGDEIFIFLLGISVHRRKSI